MVQFPAGGIPAGYRRMLDILNERIGGTAPPPLAAGVPPFYVVDGTADNVQPLTLVDPTLINLNFLQVNTRENADFIAGELTVQGLHSWVVSASSPATFR